MAAGREFNRQINLVLAESYMPAITI